MRIDRRTGTVLWEARLAGSQFVNIQMSGDDLLAATRGELYCLDPATGQLKWQNSLPGMGFGIVAISGDNDNASAIAQEMQQRQQQAANSGTV